MTEILEEPVERKQESEAELKRRHEEAVKRGEEVVALVQKEITEIDRCKDNSKTCAKQPQSKTPHIGFKTIYRSMQVKSIAECSKGSILQYF